MKHKKSQQEELEERMFSIPVKNLPKFNNDLRKLIELAHQDDYDSKIID